MGGCSSYTVITFVQYFSCRITTLLRPKNSYMTPFSLRFTLSGAEPRNRNCEIESMLRILQVVDVFLSFVLNTDWICPFLPSALFWKWCYFWMLSFPAWNSPRFEVKETKENSSLLSWIPSDSLERQLIDRGRESAHAYLRHNFTSFHLHTAHFTQWLWRQNRRKLGASQKTMQNSDEDSALRNSFFVNSRNLSTFKSSPETIVILHDPNTSKLSLDDPVSLVASSVVTFSKTNPIFQHQLLLLHLGRLPCLVIQGKLCFGLVLRLLLILEGKFP